MSTVAERLLTADEFMARYGHLSGVELVDGRVVWPGMDDGVPPEAAMPRFRHGVVLNRIASRITQFVEDNKLGWLASGETFVQTQTDPDKLRGADFLFVSYLRLPAGPTPEDLSVSPDLVVEVRSPTDRWTTVFAKVTEYLDAGVRAVLVLDPVSATASVYRPDAVQEMFRAADTLVLPDVLPGFSTPVGPLFT